MRLPVSNRESEPPGRKSRPGPRPRISLLPEASRVEQHVLARADSRAPRDAGANLLRISLVSMAGSMRGGSQTTAKLLQIASTADCMSILQLAASPVPSCAARGAPGRASGSRRMMLEMGELAASRPELGAHAALDEAQPIGGA